ncbi:DNA replication regulator SLD2 [Ophiocordyceps camponoti-floridani]|uniref:DNA replication regulator SLD2 n=1 Tax=Ophiocordyceps camponoti-floridani TaxID=2030778 RepID=A0A8H4VGD5_9HYPO|nr:DNA replication regulator SLD2 [Ophiocordyceps camponoti-floridani]
MNDEQKLHYQSRAKDLRAQLKRWEEEWATAHEGNKPGRQDIKSRRDIAGKYKEYNRVRDVLSGKVPPPEAKDSGSKRRGQPLPSETPLKRTKHSQAADDDDDEVTKTPSISRKLFSPTKVTWLGPTPQKEGRVLGLLDLLTSTPTKANKHSPSPRGKDAPRTPSKTLDLQATARKLTPSQSTSPSKRQRHMSTTPRRYRGELALGATPTPKSAHLHSETPSFLRRRQALAEETESKPLAPLKLPRKPLIRGLSDIVAGLRRVEEEALDEDLEALREVEGGRPGEDVDELAGDDTAGSNPQGNEPPPPMKAYKKKDPKRTTRKPRPPEFILDVFSDPRSVRDVVKAILHTIFFTRFFPP